MNAWADQLTCDRCGAVLHNSYTYGSPDAWSLVKDDSGNMCGRHHRCDPSRRTLISTVDLAEVRAREAGASLRLFWPANAKFSLGAPVRKKSGSQWRGRVRGF
jgi:hypothetical protein